MRLGLVQMCSGIFQDGNIAVMRSLVSQATEAGCHLIAFPEVAGVMNRRLGADGVKTAGEDRYILACQDAAAAHGIWIHAGSTPVLAEGDGDETRFLNHSCLINDRGQMVAGYDKIHLFDIHPDNRPPILESKRYAPGKYSVMPVTPWGPFGMAICYDLRFPQLFTEYARAGATLLFVPSAFTVATGEAHWEVLLRARAIENGAFVIAAAQVGQHEDGRETYGHGMVVDPWGHVLVDMEDRLGLAVVDLDLNAVARARSQIPNLKNARPYERR